MQQIVLPLLREHKFSIPAQRRKAWKYGSNPSASLLRTILLKLDSPTVQRVGVMLFIQITVNLQGQTEQIFLTEYSILIGQRWTN